MYARSNCAFKNPVKYERKHRFETDIHTQLNNYTVIVNYAICSQMIPC